MNYEETYVYTDESCCSRSYGGSDGSLRIINRKLSYFSCKQRSIYQHSCSIFFRSGRDFQLQLRS